PFPVPFTCLWIGRPGSPVRKASVNVRECPGLSRRLLKCCRRSKTSSRRPRQKLGNEWHDLKSRKGELRQNESTSHFLARSKTSPRRPRQKLQDPRDFASGLLLSGLRVRFTAFWNSRPVYCFPDFASGLLLSGLRVHGLRVHGLRVRFTAFGTSRSVYYFPDFASGLLLLGLRVRFTAFGTSRPVYCFLDFASALLFSGLRVRFTAFRTSRPVYCFPNFESGLLLSGLRVRFYYIWDFVSTDFVSGLPLSELRVRFTAFGTSRPVYCFPDFASGLPLSGLRVHFTAFRTSRPHLLLSGLRVRGLRVHIYCFPDFASTLHAFRGLRPFTYHFTSSKSQPCYYLMIGGASYHGERRQKRSPGPIKGASHDLWLHPLTEHATKEGQAVSTPFWPTGFPHENPRSKPGLLFTTRQSEVKGSLQLSPSPVKRWSRSEGQPTVHNSLFLWFLSIGLRHVRDHSRTPRSAPKESNEPGLAPCRARSSRADPFFHGLSRLPTLGSLTRSHLSESCDSHGRFPDSFPRASRLVLGGSDPSEGDRHGLEEAIEPLGRTS
ncbi:hypothetical protein CRG98_031252, partial [Punica granatum]